MDRHHLPLNITEKIHGRISLAASIVVLLALIVTLRFLDHSLFDKPDAPTEATEEEAEETNYTTSAHIVAVGNHIFDTRIYEQGSGSWNYDFLYQNVKNQIRDADCAIVSQITPLTASHNALSGYPVYRSPAELADSLVNAGFDVIAAAGCHADDAGTEGILETLDIWKNRYPNIPVLGLHSSEEDAGKARIMEINGIRLAFLNFTYGTSSNSLAGENSYMLDVFQKESVARAVYDAQSQSDCVIFIAHWGDSDASYPTEFQTQWASYLMSLGVNVVIGTHPMCPQPYGTISDDLGHETTIFYSLGNFVAVEENSNHLLGCMADFTVEKTVENGKSFIEIKNRSVVPLVMHYCYDNSTYAPYFLSDYSEELAAHHSILYAGSSITLSGLKAQFDLLMSQEVLPSNSISLVNGSTSDTTNPESSSNAAAGEYDEYGGYYDEEGRYHDVSGMIFTNDGYYDQYNNFYPY